MFVRRAFRDAAFKRAHRLGSVNSVNVVRLLVQVVQSRTISDYLGVISCDLV